MATIAQQTMYRDEYIAGFETRQSILRETVTTETMTKGGSTYFLVTKPNRTAVTRGANGLIPSAVEDLTQVQVTLQERHDKPQKTNFNIFAGQSDQRRIMQMESIGVINRDIDLTILSTLAGTAVTTGAAAAMSKTLINKGLNALWKAKIPNDGQVFGLLTPAAWLYLSDVVGFSSKDFVGDQPLVVGPEKRRWLNVTWMMSPELPGVGTASASCFLWHKSAVGHAIDAKGMQVFSGYDEENDYSWARTTYYHGAALIQGPGAVKIVHDDTGLN
ncbi:phage capsid protein [Labrys wisconsinensis]|uniref:Capsid protein n=1 Tax=Labrys wisconsinensis TaxID=425677 RepID=A0ABU0JL59_9HYPH|nr:phage capsid protein [Labrys wisconsinensis]MDQ0475025.1 hypothetical protein [Labrys wisconsinensis]